MSSIDTETLSTTSAPTGDNGVDIELLSIVSPDPQQGQSGLRQLEHGAGVEIDSGASAVEVVVVVGADLGFDAVRVYSEVSVEADLEASAETFGAATGSQPQPELQPQRQEQLQSQSLKQRQNQEPEDSLGHHTNNEPLTSDPPNNSKRTRMQYSIDKKIEIIDYKRSNPRASPAKIAKDFGMHRTTVVGILSLEKKLCGYRSANPNQDPDAHRVVGSRTPEVERLLVVWLRELKVQGVNVSDKKIRAQAIEIHRMLSNDLEGYQHRDGHLYTESWLKRFRKRQALSLALKSVYPTGRAQVYWATLVHQSNLSSLDPNDIYICDLANIFMRMKPAGESNEPRRATQIKGDASASVLLCCNGTGNDRLPARIFCKYWK
ncbi:hypothetical protein BGX20_001875 [Mortierella sp. AD010]|nr:hypothetical protein BGX20_001875 [Mortierella sp. AD010]